ncbi:DarT ssDNA thymidine ADP-ribosyltransferase family protein [Geodermatophilus sp. SYSU D00700]
MTPPPTTDPDVAAALRARGVTRLLHFTPARNLPHILGDQRLRAVQELTSDVRAVYAHTDPHRLDGHPDKISCSIEYPNAFYLGRVRDQGPALNYPDWVFLVLDPLVAATPGALFCARNAAAAGGRLLQPGSAGLAACYAPAVPGARGRTYRRGPRHDPAAPTDAQAEVLVPGPIDLTAVRMIVGPTGEHVAQERARLTQVGLDPDVVPWGVGAPLFSAQEASDAARFGGTLTISPWANGGAR